MQKLSRRAARITPADFAIATALVAAYFATVMPGLKALLDYGLDRSVRFGTFIGLVLIPAGYFAWKFVFAIAAGSRRARLRRLRRGHSTGSGADGPDRTREAGDHP